LEQAQRVPRSPFEVAYGSLEAWEADWQASIDAGTMCPIDGPVIIACVRRWHRDGVYATWRLTR
jgi:hypothetical protein